jgi:rubrerythrin
MLSRTPVELSKIGKKELDKEILRVAIIAELDAINLYEQLAAQTDDVNIKKVLLDVAGEEKTHVGEFQTMLLSKDEEQVRELDKGKEEVKEITKKKPRLNVHL